MARDRMSISTTEPTRYEVVLRHGSAEQVLGYTARRSYVGLGKYVTANVDALLAIVPQGTRVFRAGDARTGRHAYTIGAATVAFSGRTEREAAQ